MSVTAYISASFVSIVNSTPLWVKALVHSSVDGPLGCVHFLPINTAAYEHLCSSCVDTHFKCLCHQILSSELIGLISPCLSRYTCCPYCLFSFCSSWVNLCYSDLAHSLLSNELSLTVLTPISFNSLDTCHLACAEQFSPLFDIVFIFFMTGNFVFLSIHLRDSNIWYGWYLTLYKLKIL